MVIELTSQEGQLKEVDKTPHTPWMTCAACATSKIPSSPERRRRAPPASSTMPAASRLPSTGGESGRIDTAADECAQEVSAEPVATDDAHAREAGLGQVGIPPPPPRRGQCLFVNLPCQQLNGAPNSIRNLYNTCMLAEQIEIARSYILVVPAPRLPPPRSPSTARTARGRPTAWTMATWCAPRVTTSTNHGMC